ncbi:energy transducer TonB [Allorhizobium taibaishanense]|uniref:Protein TonB n=1 Tax=Allorhizobium taibaishanense TaxID=887144 RepID=A0A1Q9ABN5_9HYPH|nr:energy transducer TonB [Allorhizobium taibaishanense]MBB4010627.1 protein TonB [Allorhizobium taibaishanense]OLP52272.1 energy transducer TonB [Allorhizobium taibaishanense]
MSKRTDLTGRRRSSLDWLLWCTAGTLAFAAHAGAVVLMLQQPEEPPAGSAPPAAVMIELAPEPEAAKVEETQIAPDQKDAEEVKSETAEKPPEPVEPPPEPQPPQPQPDPQPQEPTPPEKVEEPPPVPEMAEVQPGPPPVEEPKPVEEQVTKELDNVEVPLPLTRPVQRPVETREAPTKKKPAKVAPQSPAQKAQREAKAEVTQSDRTAASTTSSGLFSSTATPQKWQSRLQAYLERRKRYPSESRANKEEGTVSIRFQIDDSGNVLSASISRSSGFANLDQAALDAIRRSSPVPAPPPGVNKTINVPIRFDLR